MIYVVPELISSIAIVRPLTSLVNNQQQIQFISSQSNTNIYYTIDGSNPLTSNTKKVVTNNAKITIHKKTQLKYYTTTPDGYTSKLYNYRTPQHPNERPTITVYNTTVIHSDGSQKIMIQSNQPVNLM